MANNPTKSAKASKPEKKQSFLVKTYLFSYNLILVLGWSYLLYQLAYYHLHKSSIGLWETVKNTVFIFQNAAVMEIIHASTGLVPSNPIITTFQVLSRVMVVCGVVMATPTAQVSPGLPLALLAWSITEIIRYGYYAMNILNVVPHLLVWLRYTTFIALYPIGVTGELLCFYYAQSYVKQHKMWSIEMPNKYNFTFSYYYFLLFIMFLYIPLFPQMYLHMFTQRRKILGSGNKKNV
ncbi:very-long-chain (3R)-3-hydroxyacyl-CoA dehydratase 2-like [Ctenocephalides felis]|uniref:very-long-chain (3R)-3-hydroxyacyl-CoA dehydratase 2-like n=1 Tax=Ctenocephalides felis TaxID=7515 RepID=UPI000E6E3699|nr:very-long-chain (3R)-3-hydroxyacyl-CoA dehydratase 2-like [Ctenocephalides felis]XP_026467685.1 very-long-chain (3R)-3-hydroxyacyl-CoA dehydratase 2-like [Ctenocephalides felis]